MPEARGRGVGTALAEALAAEAERNDFHKLLGKLFTDNVRAFVLSSDVAFTRSAFTAATANSTAPDGTYWSWSDC